MGIYVVKACLKVFFLKSKLALHLCIPVRTDSPISVINKGYIPYHLDNKRN